MVKLFGYKFLQFEVGTTNKIKQFTNKLHVILESQFGATN